MCLWVTTYLVRREDDRIGPGVPDAAWIIGLGLGNILENLHRSYLLQLWNLRKSASSEFKQLSQWQSW